jgi:hypothetical protein
MRDCAIAFSFKTCEVHIGDPPVCAVYVPSNYCRGSPVARKRGIGAKSANEFRTVWMSGNRSDDRNERLSQNFKPPSRSRKWIIVHFSEAKCISDTSAFHDISSSPTD